MSEILLVPIHVDALVVGTKGLKLIAPLVNFTKIPYACWVSRNELAPSPELFNSKRPFTSQTIMRKPAALADFALNYLSQATGIHLHWSLPDALTVMRADPESEDRLRFPQVPNRWLITSKTKKENNWQVEGQWVVESDYLYPEQPTEKGITERGAITFPIVPAEQYRQVLTNPPPRTPKQPDDVTPIYKAVYSAPFRYMGRAQRLDDWRNNSGQPEYLHQFMPDGLTAVGYGDPLFAAIYTHCYSVFGFVHRGALNNQARRYDILGWYENTQDCLELFASLTKQDPNTRLYDALAAEYKWKPTNPPAAFPTASLYYASVDVEAQLKPNPALSGAQPRTNGPSSYQAAVAVGNTGTEALAADLATTIADKLAITPPDAVPAARILIEDQLEAIGLRHELGDAHIDLDAKFREARHTKGFQPRPGGALWSIQVRNGGSGQQGTEQPAEKPLLPAGLAHVLHDLNLKQAEYDSAWQDIETLRHRVFADWHKFDNAYNFGTSGTSVIYVQADHVPKDQQHANPKEDPTWENLKAGTITPVDFVGDDDEILSYIRDGSLQALQDRIALAGLIEIGKDATGKITFSVANANDNPYVANQYTLAHDVLLQLQLLSSQVDEYNAAPTMKQTQQEFFILRKSGPRFWQPNEPAVLLKGAVVPTTSRHGEDGRANDDDTLSCRVLSVPTTLDSGGISAQLRTLDKNKVIATIQSTIEGLRPAEVTEDTIGFSRQTEDPWHPISLEWEVSVWPETPAMDQIKGLALNNYKADFVDANYELDENDCDLLLTHPPSQFSVAKTQNVYSGRTTLTPGAGRQLAFNIEQYLMALTLADLKSEIVGANELEDDKLDYQVDKSLITWAQSHFTLTNVPALKDPASMTGKDKEEQITEQQNAVAGWYRTQHPFRIAETTKGPQGQPITKYRLVDLADTKPFPAGWYNGRPALAGSPPNLNLTTFGALTKIEQVHDALNTALRAYETVGATNVLAQSLGGFNNALLMREQFPQLPVFDLNAMILAAGSKPSSSDQKYKDLTRDVASAVARGNNSSPVTNTDFMPIRSGLMKVNKLYLVDTFGQVLDVSPSAILPSDTLTISHNVTSAVKITAQQDAGFVYLAPRIAQAARLNFRWLAADRGTIDSEDEPEMNDHQETSPVCGWLIPNHIDGSLMFYDSAGTALGSIDQGGAWEPAPGTVNRVRLDAIVNPHLRQLATYLSTFSKQHGGYWDAFSTAINCALENIEPTNFAQHESVALLIGRPIAVVRASLGLQLLGTPALNQSWRAILSDMSEERLDSRVSNEFTNVNFPIRLGEYKQFNDGLIGYWIENETGYRDDKFYASQAENIDNPNIVTHHGTAITQDLTLSAAPLKLTMLVDPRGVVHATSAVLPTKAISIPSEHYGGILQKLSVTFMTAPILTDQADIRLNLPKESGYSWSWLARPAASVWQQIDQVQATDNTLKFAPQRLVGGWLRLTPEDKKS